ncbi:GNAT family N-acetyltransferase [Proteiniclasticum sp. BAD-10]|uniref:GNAT family N-acetyltransferase n=1 Tax=Proteiniclasticum sediminis TaxID=2804028 RepID=A0A941CMN3_9CLOT|nr:GNAT family N-acetyltransferase [Proteiniclasticum sediminis]MBR0575476.1 GNAT family N-acetyltransferase [Proteiniclasticum sediminis]
MELRKATEELKEALLRYQEDWRKSGEKTVPYGARFFDLNFEEWLLKTRELETQAPSGWVTAELWFLLDEGEIVGAIAYRHGLNAYLLGVGGQIGYGVVPGKRGQGYGKAMLDLLLEMLAQRGIAKALITCNKSNPASEAVIRHGGGILENEVEDGEEIVRRYWVYPGKSSGRQSGSRPGGGQEKWI